MDAQKEAAIKKAAEAAYVAQQNLRCAEMMNTPSDPEKAKELVVEYALCRARTLEAQNELDFLINGA